MSRALNHLQVARTKLLVCLQCSLSVGGAWCTGSCGGGGGVQGLQLENSLLILLEAGTWAKFSGMSERLMLRLDFRSKLRFSWSPALAFSKMTSTSSNVSSSSLSSCTLVDMIDLGIRELSLVYWHSWQCEVRWESSAHPAWVSSQCWNKSYAKRSGRRLEHLDSGEEQALDIKGRINSTRAGEWSPSNTVLSLRDHHHRAQIEFRPWAMIITLATLAALWLAR